MDMEVVKMLKEREWDGEGLRLEYWTQWQILLCALIVTIHTVIAVRLLIATQLHLGFKSERMWVPCWRNLDPLWLLLFRVFAFIFMASQLYQVFLYLGGAFVFYFYTQWTFALVILYFALATIISARGCWMYHKKPFYEARADSLDKLAQAVYQACAGAVVLTDIVFWCLILPFAIGDIQLTTLTVSLHSVNAVFLIIDSTLNSQPLTWYGISYFALWSVSYSVFSWSLRARGFTWWTYPFLDLSTQWAPLWYIAMGLIHAPCFGVYIKLVKAKESLFSGMSSYIVQSYDDDDNSWDNNQLVEEDKEIK